MNNLFSLRRFALLTRKHYAENGRYYLSITAGILLLLLFPLWIVNSLELYFGYAAFVCIAGAILWLHRTCRNYYRPGEALLSYTLPATQGEKYLFCWFNSYLVPGILFLALLMLVVGFSRIGGSDHLRLTLSDLFNWFGIPFLLFTSLLHALALFSCSWVKRSPIKGYLLIAAIIFVSMIVYARTTIALADKHLITPIPGLTMTCLSLTDNSLILYSINTFSNVDAARTIAIIITITFFWTAGYFKFRERTLK